MPVPIDAGWVDILPPEAPAQSAGTTLVWSLSVFLLLAGIAGILWYRRQHQAKRRLRHLLQELRIADADSKSCCAQIICSLREKQTARHLLHWSKDPDWQQYLRRLEACRYSADPLSKQQLESLVEEALMWLNRKRPVR